MSREPKPKRDLTSTGNSSSAGSSPGSQLGGDGMPCSSKKRCVRYLSADRRDHLGVRQEHDRAELLAVLREQELVEVGQRDDQLHVVLADQLLQRGEVARVVDPRHDRGASAW